MCEIVSQKTDIEKATKERKEKSTNRNKNRVTIIMRCMNYYYQ